MITFGRGTRGSILSACVIALIQGAGAAPAPQHSREIEIRSRIAAANLEDAIVVDCQLPGTLQKLGGMRTYLTPGTLARLSAVDCRSRGGEYTLGDLSSGTLSLERWLPLAEKGEAEAQYYVARIYANGMGGVPIDNARAVAWYQRAAQQQYSSALQELGYMYEQGLGVERDAVQALNLQRKAAGLGAELDYAWKITAAEADAARQVAALAGQLDLSNAEVETLRTQVATTTDALFKSRADLGRSESTLLDLKEQLQAANEAAPAVIDAAALQELQRALVEKQAALAQSRNEVETLTARAREQQGELNDRLARTQLSSRELTELLANEQEKNRSLLARAAQTEQRLLRSQQELADLRDQYRAEVDQFAADRDEFERAAAKSKDSGAGLVAAAERELERQKLRVASLERTLAAASAAPKKDEAAALLGNLKQLQARYEEQQRQLERQRSEFLALQTKSGQERTALVREMNEQVGRRAAELEAKQRRLASLSAETDTLRGELDRLNEQREHESSEGASEATQAREALRMAQEKIADQRERLQRMHTERATEIAQLTAGRAQLETQLSVTQQASETKVAFLRQDLDARRKDIEAKEAEIGRLEQRLANQTKLLDDMMAGARKGDTAVLASNVVAIKSPAPAAKGSADAYLNDLSSLRQGDYRAVVIGNSDYRYMGGLDTPTRDARELATLLEQRYNFKVRLLTNATSDQIMTALHDETLALTEADSLLIYYAGHGDATDVPGRAFWLGVDADPDTRKGWLEADHIRAKIKEMKAKHVLLVADSCFSDAITHPKTTTIGRGLTETRLRVQLTRRARMVLTSGQAEPMPDSVGDRTHSAFARQFLQILRQNNTIMSGEMLSHELSERLQAAALTAQVELRQKPTYSTLKDANHDVGDFFFMPTAEQVRVAGL